MNGCSPRDAEPDPILGDSCLILLAALVTRLTPAEGVHESAIRGLTVIRANSPSIPTPAVYDPSLCIVVQGRKRAMLGDEVYLYDALNYLTVSVTLPAMGHVLEATEQRPYLCLRLELDARLIGDLLLQVGRGGVPPHAYRGSGSSRGGASRRL